MVEPGEEQTDKRHQSSCWHLGLSPGKMEIKFHWTQEMQEVEYLNRKQWKEDCSSLSANVAGAVKVDTNYSTYMTKQHSSNFESFIKLLTPNTIKSTQWIAPQWSFLTAFIPSGTQTCCATPLSSKTFTEIHMSLVHKWFSLLFYGGRKMKRVCS